MPRDTFDYRRQKDEVLFFLFLSIASGGEKRGAYTGRRVGDTHVGLSVFFYNAGPVLTHRLLS